MITNIKAGDVFLVDFKGEGHVMRLQPERDRHSVDLVDPEGLSADARGAGSCGERSATQEHGALRNPDDGSEDSPAVLLYPPDGAGDEGNRHCSAGSILLYGRRGVIASGAPGLMARCYFSALLYSWVYLSTPCTQLYSK